MKFWSKLKRKLEDIVNHSTTKLSFPEPQPALAGLTNYSNANLTITDLIVKSTFASPTFEESVYNSLIGTEVVEKQKQKTKEVYVSSIEDYLNMDEKHRRGFESFLFDHYFSQEESKRSNFLSRLKGAKWNAKDEDGRKITYHLNHESIKNLFTSINKIEYAALNEKEKAEIKALVRERYNERVKEELNGKKIKETAQNRPLTREQRIKDMAKSIVVPYATSSGFLNAEVIDYLLK